MTDLSPTPWHITDTRDGETLPVRDILSGNGGVVAYDVLSDADAFLIAASPDLLAACKFALAVVPLAMDRYREVIARAEGRAP